MPTLHQSKYYLFVIVLVATHGFLEGIPSPVHNALPLLFLLLTKQNATPISRRQPQVGRQQHVSRYSTNSIFRINACEGTGIFARPIVILSLDGDRLCDISPCNPIRLPRLRRCRALFRSGIVGFEADGLTLTYAGSSCVKVNRQRVEHKLILGEDDE